MAIISNPPALPVRSCAQCGDEFTTSHRNRRFCSVRCRQGHNANAEADRVVQSLDTPMERLQLQLSEKEVVFTETIKVGQRGNTALLIDANVQQQLADTQLPQDTTPDDWIE